MRRRVTACALLLSMLLVGCERGRTEPTESADPPGAFSPHETLELHQTRSWGGFKIELEKVFARGGGTGDIDLDVEVAYTNLAPEAAKPPAQMRFELDGKIYPADPGKVDYLIPSGATSEETINGTLVDVALDGRPLRDEMPDILDRVSLVYGSELSKYVLNRLQRGASDQAALGTCNQLNADAPGRTAWPAAARSGANDPAQRPV